MTGTHTYSLTVTWTGNLGQGTSAYRDYSRAHAVSAPGKPTLLASADPSFRGDAERWNPEELLVAALAQCHMLWYLHLAALAGVIVTAYRDEPVGQLLVERDGGGHFSEVVLHPVVWVADADMVDAATAAHPQARAKCFIARSVNFPVRHEPTIRVTDEHAGSDQSSTTFRRRPSSSRRN